MRYKLHHQTCYNYSARASYSHHLAHLAPLETPCQKVISHGLKVTPKPQQPNKYVDYFGNNTEYFSIMTPHEELEINAYSEVEVLEKPALPPSPVMSWEIVREQLKQPKTEADILASEFLYSSPNCPLSEKIQQYTLESFTPQTCILKAALDFNQKIHTEFRFDPKVTNVSTSVEEVFKKKAGVCQDFAHFQISALRSIGLAARYVSGYIRTDPPPGKPRMIGADASHAWISLYVPTVGWVEYDSTNNIIPTTNHITVAYGRDYSDISPIKGIVYGGGTQSLEVGVTVTPLTD